jgi:hypothetical protein
MAIGLLCVIVMFGSVFAVPDWVMVPILVIVFLWGCAAYLWASEGKERE